MLLLIVAAAYCLVGLSCKSDFSPMDCQAHLSTGTSRHRFLPSEGPSTQDATRVSCMGFLDCTYVYFLC